MRDPSNNAVYYVSGVPYAGKTTTIDKLLERREAGHVPEFFATPPDFFVRITPDSPFWVKRLVLDWSFVQNLQKNHRLRTDRHQLMLCDRSPLDFLVFAVHHGRRTYARYLDGLQQVGWVDGVVILLTCDRSTMIARMGQRDGITPGEAESIADRYLEGLDRAFERVHESIDVVSIDTSNRSIDEVVARVEAVIDGDAPTVDFDGYFADLPRPHERQSDGGR